MNFKRVPVTSIFLIALSLSGCNHSSSESGSPNGDIDVKTLQLTKVVGVRAERDLRCDVGERPVFITMPASKSGEQLDDYIVKLVGDNEMVWRGMEPDLIRNMYLNCLEPELITRLEN